MYQTINTPPRKKRSLVSMPKIAPGTHAEPNRARALNSMAGAFSPQQISRGVAT
jgi:hypothetical protein